MFGYADKPKPYYDDASSGIANCVVRDGPKALFRDEMHVTFEYKNKEYNYGTSTDSDPDATVMLRIPLKRKQPAAVPVSSQ
jgi:hypothetical protein